MRAKHTRTTNEQQQMLIPENIAVQMIKEFSGRNIQPASLPEYYRRRILPKPVVRYKGVQFFDREDFISYMEIWIKPLKNHKAAA